MGIAGAGALVYLVAALGVTYPLLRVLGAAIVSHWDIDAVHAFWVQWWVATAVASPDLELFRTPLLHFPSGADLQFADINLAVNLPFVVLARLTSPTLAYNLLLLASFVLSACAMWAFAAKLSRSVGAGWVAGLLFAASPYWISSTLNAWVYLVHVWVFPVAALAIARALRTERPLDFVWVGLAFGVTFHVSPQYFVLGGTLLACLLGWQLRTLRDLASGGRGQLGLAIALAVTAALVLPRAVPMWLASGTAFSVHDDPVNIRLAARAIEYVMPSAHKLYAGFSVVFLSFTLPSLIAVGGWRSERRAHYLPWLVSAGILLVLALGPFAVLRLGGRVVTFPLPERLLLELPGFSQLTNHWRWVLPAWFCLTSAGALAIADLVRGRTPALRGAVVCAVALAYAAEVRLVFPTPSEMPLWFHRPSPIARVLRDEPRARVVHDLSRFPKLNQTAHGRPITGGWLPRVDTRTEVDSRVLRERVAALAGMPARARFLAERDIDTLVLDQHRAVLISLDPGMPGGLLLEEIEAPRRSGKPARSD